MVRERSILEYDADVIPGWERYRKFRIGAIVFQRPGRSGPERLTVMNLDSGVVEAKRGVDLLFHHAEYELFVLVQYKRLREERGDWLYRPDASLWDEVDRMHTLPTIPGPQRHQEFRLDPELCYLKLCDPSPFEPSDPALFEGAFIPLQLWELLCGRIDKSSPADEVVGVRGGLGVRPSTVRHLSNTKFIQLLQDGWIGSRRIRASQIHSWVAWALEHTHSIIVAESQHVR